MDQNIDIASNRTSKKWIIPVLWFFLVTWSINGAYPQSPYFRSLDPNVSSEEDETTINSTTKSFNKATLLPKVYGTHPNITHALANITTSNKAAVIIETRASGNIVPLVLHFSTVLGPTWPVIIYTSAENFGAFSTSHALLRYQKIGRIIVRPLADGVWFPNWNSVSMCLTTRWLWEDLAPAEHILLFQSDSILCANAVRSVDDFFQYDYIGAPIHQIWGVGYNGGLSLRKRSTILKVLDGWTYRLGEAPEDQWYYARMRDLEREFLDQGMEGVINLPSMEIARTFAVETIDYPHPLGLHQPMRFIGPQDHMIPLDEWCPEYKLATTERIVE